METNKINQVLPYIVTNITELNKLIYAGAKLVCEKIVFISKSTKKKSKPGGEIRLETQIRNPQKQAKMMKRRKNAGTYRQKVKGSTRTIAIQLVEINRKVLVKKEDFSDIDEK